ncbi:MAG: DUF1926 domain-containing protein [Spirochaetes bacterium]|nr:DUF1926 domain-containing protein [Spirochaetota bacterium]
MSRRQIVLGTYNHLPEGFDTNRFETIYQTCYRPFLSTLYRFPEISVFLHFSGSLLRRLETRHPEFLMLLEEMVTRKQVELAGGGFYSPVFPLIPTQDRLGQIELLTTFIRKHFGKRPRGAWLSNYAWEPSIASALRTSGMDFTFLLDRHFREAGFSGDGLFSPVLTEDQGRTIAVFPVFDGEYSFGARLGFIEMLEAIGHLSDGRADGERPCTVLMLPGESARHLWQASGCETPDLYFETAFNELRKASLAYETITASRALRSRKRFSRAYFPCCATDRLLHPDETIRSLGNGDGCFTGSVRGAVLRFQESANLYSKMHYVHLLVGQLRGDKSRKATAQEGLWAAQAGEVYWPSGTPGLLDLGIRDAAFRSLIDAELTTRSKGTHKPSLIRADIDFDGENETLFQGHEYNAYLRTSGASLFELDVLRRRRNYASSLAPPGSGFPVRCFSDTLELTGGDGNVMASEDLAGAFFSVLESKRPNAEALFGKELALSMDGQRVELWIEKGYNFRKNLILLVYSITNKSDISVDCVLRSSSAWTPVTRREDFVGSVGFQDRSMDIDALSDAAIDLASRITFASADGDDSLSLVFDKPAVLAMASLELAAPKESPSPRGSTDDLSLYQGVSLAASWRFTVKPERSWQVRIAVEFGEQP